MTPSNQDTMTPDAAVQMVYLAEGIELVKDHKLDRAGGHIGMVNELLPYAKAVSSYLENSPEQDFAGVFEYEVTNPMGQWLASVGGDSWPSLKDFNKELKQVGARFFTKP